MKITQMRLFCASLGILLLTLFTPQTLIMAAITIHIFIKLLRAKYEQFSQNGVISLLPENIRNQLMSRSLFDWLCDFWFMESLNIIKVCVKPFIAQVQPDNAEEVLNQLSCQTKQKFMTKGILNILPLKCQQLILPSQNIGTLFSQKCNQPPKKRVNKSLFKSYEGAQSSATDDEGSQTTWKIPQRSTFSLNNIKTMKRICSQSQITNELDIDSPLCLSRDQSIISFSTKKRSKSQKWDKLQFYNSIKSQLQNEGIVKTAHNVINMVKKVIQLRNLSQNVQNVNSRHLVKIMIVFWIIILVQIKLSPYARKIIFKALYAICGTVSVIGALTSSVFMLYKLKNESKRFY